MLPYSTVGVTTFAVIPMIESTDLLKSRRAGSGRRSVGWNFRRSIRFGPLRFNLSKSGVGTSVGIPGFRVGKDAKGRDYQQTSLPGTGIYRRDYSGATPQQGTSVWKYVLIGVAVLLAVLRALFRGR
jgi:hypothetical protein